MCRGMDESVVNDEKKGRSVRNVAIPISTSTYMKCNDKPTAGVCCEKSEGGRCWLQLLFARVSTRTRGWSNRRKFKEGKPKRSSSDRATCSGTVDNVVCSVAYVRPGKALSSVVAAYLVRISADTGKCRAK